MERPGRRTAGHGRRIAVALLLAVALPCCGGPPEDPATAEAERQWAILQADPTTPHFESFKAANLAAALRHEELHDRLGVQFQVRAYEAQADEAARTSDAATASRLAYEVIDGIDDLTRRDLVRAYEETLPGAEARLVAARARASGALR